MKSSTTVPALVGVITALVQAAEAEPVPVESQTVPIAEPQEVPTEPVAEPGRTRTVITCSVCGAPNVLES